MTTKKQHFVPRFYLRHFTNAEGKLQVYRRSADTYFLTTPESVCAENYLYEVRHLGFNKQNGNPEFLHNYIEKKLAKAESCLAPLFEQLIDCCVKCDFETDKYHEGKLAVCNLAASLIVRHPQLLEEDRAGASELTRTFLTTNKLTENERWMLKQIDIENDLDMVSETAIMQTLLLSEHPESPRNRIYKAFADKSMTIIRAPAGMNFITTSMPLDLNGIDEEAYDFQIAYMPLTNKFAALFSKDEHLVDFGMASLKETVQFNAALLANSFWDTAISQARGPLEIAVSRWKELVEAQ